jgi:hypothetical protein
VARLDGAAGAGGEDVVRRLPPLSRPDPSVRLSQAVPAQGRDTEAGERYGAMATAPGVVVAEDATAAPDLVQRVRAVGGRP